ncbi:MAG: hypothetical protein JSU02_07285 [Bacteroidetes bacterium]|nr:hypothetical protein [Bacteroidota bacterium]
MLRKLLNILAPVSLLGYILLYSFWPAALLFGDYKQTLRSNDPKDIGLDEFRIFLHSQVLPYTCLVFILSICIIIYDYLFGNNINLSKWSIRLLLGVFLAIIILGAIDPGGYWFWFFD